MKRLTAQRPILYGGRMYQAGDTLPAYDKRMVQAWLSAESAKMTDDAAEEATMPPQDADGGQDGTENADTTQAPRRSQTPQRAPRRPQTPQRAPRRARRTTTATIAVTTPTWWRATWIPHSWQK